MKIRQIAPFSMLCLLLVFSTASCSNDRKEDRRSALSSPDIEDGELVVKKPGAETSAAFALARSVLDRHCTSCHSPSGSAAYLDLTGTESDLLNKGLVSVGEPDQSNLVVRIVNFGGSNSTMPPGGSAIPDEDYQALRDWISGLGQEDTPPMFLCNDSTRNQPLDRKARRLSYRQFVNTYKSFYRYFLNRIQAESTIDSMIESTFFPADGGSGFKRKDETFMSQHTRSIYNMADAIAEDVSENHYQAAVNAFLNLNPGSCNRGSNLLALSADCRGQLVRNMGRVILRRPLYQAADGVVDTNNEVIDEAQAYLSEYGLATNQKTVFNNLLFRMLMAPHFTHTIEDQNQLLPDSSEPGVFRLSPYAVINRLSYALWNDMPDQTLFELAASATEPNKAFIRSVVNHVIQSPNLGDSAAEFAYDWLKLSRTPNFNSSHPKFQYLAEGTIFDNQMRSRMIAEVEDLSSFVFRTGGVYSDLFTSSVQLAKDAQLMSVYNQSEPAGSLVDLSNARFFSPTERAGILTRAAMLVSGSELASPIIRGIHVRKDIMCLDLSDPPDGALESAAAIDIPADTPIREKVTLITSGPSCKGCHELINPLGFGLNQYDSLGKFRLQEPLFNEMGDFLNRHAPIEGNLDLSTVIRPGVISRNATEFSRIISEQRSTQKCFSEKLTSFVLQRNVDEKVDGCRLNQVADRMNTQSLRSAVQSLVEDPAFLKRRLSTAGGIK